jgi:hypothetical protein
MITDYQCECLRRIHHEGDYDGVEFVAEELEMAGLIYIDDEDEGECWLLTVAGMVAIGEETGE